MAEPMDLGHPAASADGGATPRALIACPRPANPPNGACSGASGSCLQKFAVLGARRPAAEGPCIAFPSLSGLSRLVRTRVRLLFTAESSAVRLSSGDPTEPASSSVRSALAPLRASAGAAVRGITAALSRKRSSVDNAGPQQLRPAQPTGAARATGSAKKAYDFAEHCAKTPCAASPFARALVLARAPSHSPVDRRPAGRLLAAARAVATLSSCRPAPRA